MDIEWDRWEQDRWEQDGPDDLYDIDPEEEDREIESRLAAYERWLDRT